MAVSDSVFLFEVTVEKLHSFTKHNYDIKCNFGNVFSFPLNYSNERTENPTRRKSAQRTTVRQKCARKLHSAISTSKEPVKHTMLYHSTPQILQYIMKSIPMELSIKSNDDIIGSSRIPWNKQYLEYLTKLKNNTQADAITVAGKYNLFRDKSSSRVATVQLSITLSYLENGVTDTQFKITPESIIPNILQNTQTCSHSGISINSTCSTNQNYVQGSNKAISVYNIDKSKSKPNFHEELDEDQLKDFTSLMFSNVNVNDLKKVVDSMENTTCKFTINRIKSCSTVYTKNRNKYERDTLLENQIYYVAYCTVEKDFSTARGPTSSPVSSASDRDSDKAVAKYSDCASDCSRSSCSVDLADDNLSDIKVIKCRQITCGNRNYQRTTPQPDNKIVINLDSLQKPCCITTDKLKTANTDSAKDPCYCTCECVFGFTTKTTYCPVCGGYEVAGDDLSGRPYHAMPYPCPVYHKLVDLEKLKSTTPWSTKDSLNKMGQQKGPRVTRSKTLSVREPKKPKERKTVESGNGRKKGKKFTKPDKAMCDYNYQAPKIGATEPLGYVGIVATVPSSKGWLWDSERVPGLKFRPKWKPGASNKRVVNMLKLAKNPGDVIAKKRKKDGKQKKKDKRPLLVVHKKDGEFDVTIETMKTYPRQRALNQQPFEDKPLVTYTVGRTDEENMERLKKKQRVQRRLEREQRRFIQSTFENLCEEICLKSYQQALGLLPCAEDPKCPCFPAEPDADKLGLDRSCSCSEDKSSLGTVTDSDEWILEFTPPNARYEPTKPSIKIVTASSSTQYSYLDYRVKLLDRFGNPVPRFFKGPDCTEQCSDLGGFWGPEHKWLEINSDGFIAPDNRWAPSIFIGPAGETVHEDGGKFQIQNGTWLVIGVDGYVDIEGKWRYYKNKPRPVVQAKEVPVKSQAKKGTVVQSVRGKSKGTKGAEDSKNDKAVSVADKSVPSWSCLGENASPNILSSLGIVGHGHDKKLLLLKLNEMLARGDDVTIPQIPIVPRSPMAKTSQRHLMAQAGYDRYLNRYKCNHAVPSSKGVVAVDAQGNKTYFTLYDSKNLRPQERMDALKERGIALSSYHVPCFDSFIRTEVMKREQLDRLTALARDENS